MIHSYTSISTFHDVCPRQAHERFVLRIPVEDTPEMQTGKRVHSYIEQFIKGEDALPAWLDHVEGVIMSMQKLGPVVAELKMAVDRDLQFAKFFDNERAYIRGSIDALMMNDENAIIVDWKTGKKRDKELQLMLYALFLFAAVPDLQQITAMNFYTFEQNGMGAPFTWRRSQVPTMWREVVPLVQEIEEAAQTGHWPERPSGLCGWCPVKACKHWKAPKPRQPSEIVQQIMREGA